MGSWYWTSGLFGDPNAAKKWEAESVHKPKALEQKYNSECSLLCRAPASLHHCSVASIRRDPNIWAKASGPEHWIAKASFHYLGRVRNCFLYCSCPIIPKLKVFCVSIKPWRFCSSSYSLSRSNIIYVASNHFVWRLIPVPMATQIQQLLQDKQFELALQLAVSLVSEIWVWACLPHCSPEQVILVYFHI